MSDDIITSALTNGGVFLSGGGVVGFVVVNLFALRATNPSALLTAPEQIGRAHV